MLSLKAMARVSLDSIDFYRGPPPTFRKPPRLIPPPVNHSAVQVPSRHSQPSEVPSFDVLAAAAHEGPKQDQILRQLSGNARASADDKIYAPISDLVYARDPNPLLDRSDKPQSHDRENDGVTRNVQGHCRGM